MALGPCLVHIGVFYKLLPEGSAERGKPRPLPSNSLGEADDLTMNVKGIPNGHARLWFLRNSSRFLEL